MNEVCLVSLVLIMIIGSSYGNSLDTRGQTKKFQNSLNQQNLQTLLTSIEERLRNLDSVYSTQYSPSVEGRLAHFGRKLEGIEAKITRLETILSNEMEKLLETINGRRFKDDIANDHVIRKIDNAYERLSHRMVYNEGKIDMSEKKLENKLNTILSKLDKLEDNLMVRESDMQEELSEVFTSIEEVKTQSDNVLEKLENVTRSFSKNSARSFDENTEDFGKDIKKQLEIITEKMVNFHEYSWGTHSRIENYVRSIGLVTNQSRYEVQSGLRALTIEVGRMAGNHHLVDNSKGREKLEELEKKMDNNFNSVMSAQNTFLESCYRVQKDEAQLESKIGEVLEKLLETFSEKTVVEPKDVRRIEQILKNHDQYMRKSTVDTIKTVASLLQKDYNFEKKFDNTLSAITSSLETLQNSINEQNTDDSFDEKLEEIIASLKDLQSLSIDINTNVKTNVRETFPNAQEIKSLIDNLKLQSKEEMIKENFEGLNRILEDIRYKIIVSMNQMETKHPQIFNNTNLIIFNDTKVPVNCLDLPIDVRYRLNCINTTGIDSIVFPNDSNNTSINCLDLPIDVRTSINCTNGNDGDVNPLNGTQENINQGNVSEENVTQGNVIQDNLPEENITRNPRIDQLINDIFLRNFTISTNITDLATTLINNSTDNVNNVNITKTN
ncbi:putative leucine-rich repeat-containing protein DDB_G0290503 [Onthophagus taurus]|uniref:putative leucine-rich repeat-containing protein DDB_G0290503 n=1 Tax=Onthophagus taurus TaxID=166361 RepID=UPI000C20FBF7|nr:centromere-associated protein E-like [Onthophagus taurus]